MNDKRSKIVVTACGGCAANIVDKAICLHLRRQKRSGPGAGGLHGLPGDGLGHLRQARGALHRGPRPGRPRDGRVRVVRLLLELAGEPRLAPASPAARKPSRDSGHGPGLVGCGRRRARAGVSEAAGSDALRAH